MSRPEFGVCTDCRRPIRWVRSEKSGRLMPLDITPHPEGNVQLVSTPAGELRARVHGLRSLSRLHAPLFGPAQPAIPDLFLPHHATCPGPRGAAQRSGKPSRWTSTVVDVDPSDPVGRGGP